MFDFLRAYKYENQIQIKFCGHTFALKEVFRFVKNRGFNLFGERVNDVKLPKSSLRCLRKASAEGASSGRFPSSVRQRGGDSLASGPPVGREALPPCKEPPPPGPSAHSKPQGPSLTHKGH